MSARITIIDDSGTVQSPLDVEFDDGGTLSLRNRASKNATLHFSGDKVLFYHGVQVDQQAAKHGGTQSLLGKGQNKTVHYQVRMARPTRKRYDQSRSDATAQAPEECGQSEETHDRKMKNFSVGAVLGPSKRLS